MELFGGVIQSLIKLTQDKREFWFDFWGEVPSFEFE